MPMAAPWMLQRRRLWLAREGITADVRRVLVEHDPLRLSAKVRPDAYASVEPLVRYALIQGLSIPAFHRRLYSIFVQAFPGRAGLLPGRYRPLVDALWDVRRRYATPSASEDTNSAT